MKLPSGHGLTKEQLVDLCERIIAEKFMAELSYAEAFETTGEGLGEGQFEDIPVLGDEDVSFLYNLFADVVIGCESALRSTLGTFMATNTVVKSW